MVYANDLHANLIASLPETERSQIIKTLSNEDAEALLYDWRFWARPKQLPPEGDWFTWLIRSGRGFGKTWTGANWINERAKLFPKYPIAIIGQTKADVRDTMVELGESSILKQSPRWFMPVYESSKRRVSWPNGAVATMFSGDEPDQLRGPQHGTVWIDELAKFKYPKDTWDQMELGLRLGPCPQVLVSTTPRPISIIKSLLDDSQTVDVHGSTYENYANLSEKFISRVVRRYEGTTLGRQELYGEVIGDVAGALWKRPLIEKYRVVKAPDLTRIIVSIDPAVTSHEDSNETGIIVAGLATIGNVKHGFTLDDLSIRGTPGEWARQAVSAYHKYRANLIVAESNNGGEMVKHTIHTIDPNITVKLVYASRGKHTRAEPIASLYEQGRGHHVGMMAELEDQMCSWVVGDTSPDRLDALVWAYTELLIGHPEPTSSTRRWA